MLEQPGDLVDGEVAQGGVDDGVAYPVGELTVLVVRDLGIVHVEWTDRDLFVEVDLSGRYIFICLTHVEGTWRNRNHSIGNSLYPSFPARNSYKLPAVVPFIPPKDAKTALKRKERDNDKI